MLGIEVFSTGSRDFETGQYQVLQGLKTCYEAFSHNRLYPTLAELIQLYDGLHAVLIRRETIRGRLPHELKEVDLDAQQLVYEQAQATDDDSEQAIALIEWALPQIRRAIDEGAGIYSFVDEHLTIEHVGIMPMYRDEGYWFVPDPQASLLHLLRYEVSLFTQANERYRALKTSVLESLGQAAIRLSPESIKLHLMEKYCDLPNPATFLCDTDLEFPYIETILPIAKRKLLAEVTA